MTEYIGRFNCPKTTIRRWLEETIPDATPSSFYTARDQDGRYVWRVAFAYDDNRIIFNREEDFVLFQLIWG